MCFIIEIKAQSKCWKIKTILSKCSTSILVRWLLLNILGWSFTELVSQHVYIWFWCVSSRITSNYTRIFPSFVSRDLLMPSMKTNYLPIGFVRLRDKLSLASGVSERTGKRIDTRDMMNNLLIVILTISGIISYAKPATWIRNWKKFK